jgi:hypothetical protein
MKKLNIPDKTDTFKLPQVIVIGGENVGKSSLLENITKCAVFPRAKQQCTKTPIRLRLQHVERAEEAQIWIEFKGKKEVLKSREEILKKVTTIMDAFGQDDIKSDEIVISISEVSGCSLQTIFYADMLDTFAIQCWGGLFLLGWIPRIIYMGATGTNHKASQSAAVKLRMFLYDLGGN